MKTYFLSYSRRDQTFALRFAHDLKAAGVDIWVDQLDIVIGQNWDRQVEAAVRRCAGFIIILSPRSAASENVADEISVALDGTKHIIPVLYEKCTVPMRLARVQFVDGTSDYQAALQRCVSLILCSHDGATDPVPGQTAADAVSEPAGLPERWTAQLLDEIEQKLVAFVGPVAGVLVKKSALEAHSEAELYQTLALTIPDQTERLKFLNSVNAAAGAQPPSRSSVMSPDQAAAPALPPELVDRLCPILTAYLGPMARHVIISEARGADSCEDLYHRLGAHIPSDRERAEFLARLQADESSR